ncbi:MAG TPA: hypothetical protein VNJ03_06430 [Vicinamibacterales bacterium]|nr:hypothetical protein [Vicinamibacterales bacterium]
MSRTHRASITATFAYLQFGLSIVVGIVMVPFVLDRVGARLFGYWLASGEVLAYAAMADLGILGVVPWMIARADGRKDRDEIRRLLSTGFVAAMIVSLAYVAIVITMWNVAPDLLKLRPDERALIAGPLAFLACVTAIVLPMRVANSALGGLQDVRFCGAMNTVWWALDAVITVTLLYRGYGLWALAIGASIPSVMGACTAVIRLRWIAPDLLYSWPRPSSSAVATLFREGSGGWLGAWGWRLSSATDAIVVGTFAQGSMITVLAMTAKLGMMLTNMAWVPGDSGLVGLAQLSGEGHGDRLTAAVRALLRVYLALATAAACVGLAINGAFVRGWVGPENFGGARLNIALAGMAICATAVHGLSTVISVLGRRLWVGIVTLVAGAAQIGLAFLLGRRLGLIGIPLAGLLAQSCLLIPLLLPALRGTTGLTPMALVRGVLVPWAARSVPLLVLSASLGLALGHVPIWSAVPIGGLVGLVALYVSRKLILDYPPVANLIRGRLAVVRLDGLLPTDPPQQPGS